MSWPEFPTLPEITTSPYAIAFADDYLFLDQAGTPSLYCTMQQLRAGSQLDTVQRIQFQYPSMSVQSVRMALGGTASSLYALEPGIEAIDLELNKPLASDSSQIVEYATKYRYRRMPAPQFLRAVGGHGMPNLSMSVIFNNRRPRDVWRIAWNTRNEPPFSHRETVQLQPFGDNEDCVHAVLNAEDIAPHTVVGLYWNW